MSTPKLTPYDRGAAAHRRGLARSRNPYRKAQPEYAEWQAGYDMQRDRARRRDAEEWHRWVDSGGRGHPPE